MKSHGLGLVLLLLAISVSAQMRNPLFAAALPAQRQMGALRLEVVDPDGKGMAAAGKLVNLTTGVERSFQTDVQGKYGLDQLPFGRYRLEVNQTGFAAQTVLLDVQSATPLTRTIKLMIDSLAFNVEIVAATPLPGAELADCSCRRLLL